MARIPIYIRQKNPISRGQLKLLHERLPDDMWPGDAEGSIYMTYQEGYRTEEAARALIEEAIATDQLTEISLSPWQSDD
jgi:hypothetical protein